MIRSGHVDITMLNRWHAEDREVVLHQLGTDPARGLAPAESSRRLREHGPNLLHEVRSASVAPPVVRLVSDPLVLALVLAAAAAGYLGMRFDCVAIGLVAAVNVLLNYHLEHRADRVLAALARLNAASARVVRGGKAFMIPAGELVPGDLAEVAAGDRVPADMRLFSAHGLFADESALTGESLPVGKDAAHVLPEGTALADRANMLFAGTLATAGSGTGIVIATGMRTEIGRIARLLAEVAPEPTPLTKRLAELGQALALAGTVAAAVVVAAGKIHHVPPAAVLRALVALMVGLVPAGLPAALAAALTIGVRRLARKGAVVRSLPAVETLGAVTVIGTEKSGSLTCDEVTVRELFLEDETLEVTGIGYVPEGTILRGGRPADPRSWETLGLALRIGALCNRSRLERRDDETWRIAGDPTEGALLTLAAKGGIRREELAARHRPFLEFPFTAERRRMTVVVPARGGRPLALTKGSPDVVLAHCLHQRTPSGVRPLSPADRERILRHGEEMAGRALRVLGLAYREDALGAESKAVERAMVWVGLVGMLDPPRPEVPPAVAECRVAGISPVIITGDQKTTALAVAGAVGALRPGDEAISGEELERLTPEALGACVERYRVYARVTAEHKLQVIRAWKRRGHLVAMTGEGINDAPALREADIGIAMGRGGTEVTREAAAVVIAEGSFPAIVAAVAEGRAVAENVRRIVEFLVAGNVAAAVALLVAALAGLPLPLVPVQLLWVNLAISALPALTLALEPLDPELMQQGPRNPRERILGGQAALQLLVRGTAIGGAVLIAFALAWRGGAGEIETARTQAFSVLAAAQAVMALASRHRSRSLLSLNPLTNPWLLGAVAVSAALLLAAVQVPPVSGVFQAVPLAPRAWIHVAALALAPLAATEALKAWLRGSR